MKRKKLILLNFCNGVYGGIESFLLNAFYCLDMNEFDVTFLTCGRTTYDMFCDEIEQRGGHVTEIPLIADSYMSKLKLYGELVRYFNQIKPDIVHINSGTMSFQFLAAKASKRAGVSRVILHSHNFLPGQVGIKECIKAILKKDLLI